MMTKRSMIFAGATVLALVTTLPAYAAGGSDPISGIDIIIKKDPGSQPLRPVSLSEEQLKQLTEMRGREGAQFLTDIIVRQIEGGGGAGKAYFKDLTLELNNQWCMPCAMPRVIDLKAEGVEGEPNYAVQINIKQ